MVKFMNMVKWNTMYWFYVFTFRKVLLLTTRGAYTISPEAVRSLRLGYNDVSFLASFRGVNKHVDFKSYEILDIMGAPNEY